MTVLSDEPVTLDAPPREAPASSGRRSRRGLRHLALHPAWLVVAASCAVLARETIRLGLNTDVFWHLAAGNWMLSHHEIIRHDVFSYTVHGRPWVAEEWGFEVLLAWMVRHVGPISYWLVSGGACVLALVVTAWRAHLLRASALWTAALSIPLAFALVLGLAPRPQDLSYLLFALELLVLTVARRRRAALVTMPVLLLIWCNVHGSFVAGLVLLAFEVLIALGIKLAAGRRMRGWRVRVDRSLGLRDATATLVVSALATLVNPHGARLWTYAVGVTFASPLNKIEEWQSPSFHSPEIIMALGIPMLAAVVVFAVGRVRIELFDLLVWLAFVAASLHALRFIPYMGIAFVGLAAPWAGSRQDSIRKTLLTWPAAVLACTLLVLGGHRPPGTIQPGAAPVASVNWLEHRSGRVFSTYAWNDYLIERHIPVFVDGRTDLYFGTSVLPTYDAISALDKRPDKVLRRWHVRWVIWPTHTPLSFYLMDDPGWRLAKHFKGQDIFERA